MTEPGSHPSPTSTIAILQTRSLADAVRDEIEAMVLDGRFKPTERINELALATQLGVSRGPVREACSALAALGLLESIPNRGFFVRRLDDAELAEVAEARAYVFASIVSAVALRSDAAAVADLRALLLAMDEAAERGNVRDYYPINLRFHTRLGELCRNRRLAGLYQGLARELHVQRYRALSNRNSLALSNAEHTAIVDAIAAGDDKRAFDAGLAHVLNGFARMRRAPKR
ncbi:FCD domain-containing protein [Mongoliimonas terrestris]|uniref:FCD domain-containing protein n=1 Tax=Mongoliimonas terrestris TaxID=1709001 RepID=UPI0015880134|nr:FCD domain-containing protein [Mongoliimonas terrestris]